jgi:hypothetical protein
LPVPVEVTSYQEQSMRLAPEENHRSKLTLW